MTFLNTKNTIDDIEHPSLDDGQKNIPGVDSEPLDPKVSLRPRVYGSGNNIIGIDDNNGLWAGATDFDSASVKIALDGTLTGFGSSVPFEYSYSSSSNPTMKLTHSGANRALVIENTEGTASGSRAAFRLVPIAEADIPTNASIGDMVLVDISPGSAVHKLAVYGYKNQSLGWHYIAYE